MSSNFIVTESLMDALNNDDKWHMAFATAKLAYLETLLIVSDPEAPRIIKFINDFAKKCESLDTEKFSAQVSIDTAFGFDVISLEITFKQSAEESKKLFIIFDETGEVVQAAIG
jgi:hypothetical protein